MIEGIKSPKQSFKPISLEDSLQAIILYCENENINLAVYRKPHSTTIIVLIDSNSSTYPEDRELEELNQGFVFAPFDKAGKKYFINAEVKISLAQEVTYNTSNEGLAKEIFDSIKNFQPTQTTSTLPTPQDDNESNAYELLVEKSIKAIKAGKFQKIVPARTKTITLHKSYSIARHFLNLESNYKNAFVSLTYTPESKFWLGATPEILIETNKNEFKTVALAGTQALGENNNLADVAWRQKEIEEQAFVSRYIINCFKKIRLREFDENGPKTVIAGNLIHLQTEFLVDMHATNFPQLGSVMLKLLHPTSAVCGMPLEPSLKFILENEIDDRKFFSGYLGPVNMDEQTSIYVNLRCMELNDNKATFYAGAGVTESSDPYKEWKETEMKIDTLLDLIE